MTIRAKDVIKIKILGASDKTVSNSKSFTDVETFVGSLLEKILIKSFIYHPSPSASISLSHHYAPVLFLIAFFE